MTELTISPEEIRSAISSYVSSLETGTSREEVGTVADTGDGIAHVEGLPSAMTNELLEFEGGILGVALNLDVREIGAVILGPFGGIEEGQPVKRTGNIGDLVQTHVEDTGRIEDAGQGGNGVRGIDAGSRGNGGGRQGGFCGAPGRNAQPAGPAAGYRWSQPG